MLRRIAPAVFCVMAFSPMALAADEAAMPNLLFKNTWRVQNRFAVSEIFVNPDHSWIAFAVTADAQTSGTWEYVDGALCATQTTPPQKTAPPKSFCEKIAGRKLGDAWEKTDPKIGLVRSSLVAGRRDR